MPASGALSRSLHSLVAFAAGALMVLAFAPFSYPYVALLSLVILAWQWSGIEQSKTGFRLGWFYGLGLMSFGIFWLRISIDQFGSVGTSVAVVITFVFIIIVALYFALLGWLLVRFTRPSRARLLVVLPALWVLIEWLKGWVLTGFPWLSLGYSQIDLPLAAYAPLVGVYGVSGLLVFSSALLVSLYQFAGFWRLFALIVLAGIWGGGVWLQSQDWTTPKGDALKVSLVQGNVPQQIKWDREQLMPTLELYSTLTIQHWDSDLILWPETAVPAFLDQVDEPFVKPLAAVARENNTLMLFGVPVYDPDKGSYFNAMVALGEGKRDQYYKRHLVPFGEFLPLRFLLEPLHKYIAVPMDDFSRGDPTKPVVSIGQYKAGVSICYEDAFGDEISQALPEADFLVNASNDAWFGDSLAPYQHLEMARMRALETGRYLLRVTNTGISAIIDAKGRLDKTSPLLEQDVLTGSMQPMYGMTPYARWGNLPVILAVLVMVVIGAIVGRRV